MVRRVTHDLHTRTVLEDLTCDSHLQVPLHRKCLPACGPTTCHTRHIQTTFVYRLFPCFRGPDVLPPVLLPSRFPSGGGGSASFSKIGDIGDTSVSVRSTLGTRTLSMMRQFIEDVEKDGESATGDSELNVKEMCVVKDTRPEDQCNMSGQQGHSLLNKDAIKALRRLFEDFESQLQCQNEGCDDSTSDEEHEGEPSQERVVNSITFSPEMKKMMRLLYLGSRSSIYAMIGFNPWQR